MLAATESLKYRMVLTVLYAAGLRLAESPPPDHHGHR